MTDPRIYIYIYTQIQTLICKDIVISKTNYGNIGVALQSDNYSNNAFTGGRWKHVLMCVGKLVLVSVENMS